MSSLTPLNKEELAVWLDDELDAVLSMQRTTRNAAIALARLNREKQDYARHWIDIIAKTNPELAFHFSTHVAEALEQMPLEDTEAWIIQTMDVYDKMGLYPAVAILTDISTFSTASANKKRTAKFDDVAPMLEIFLQALSGRRLKLTSCEQAYTDTAIIFLPAKISIFNKREENLRLYKIMAAHLWAQARFGTFQGTTVGRLTETCHQYADPDYAQRLFYALETIRLDASLARELPGLYRELEALKTQQALPEAFASQVPRLCAPDATVEDTYAALAAIYGCALPTPFCYQGILNIEAVDQAMAERIEKERITFQMALKKIQKEKTLNNRENKNKFHIQTEKGHQKNYKLMLDGQPLTPPPDVKALMHSILQDLGDIPEEYLVPARDGEYAANDKKRPADTGQGTGDEEGAFLYNEWDYRRQHYRKDWCVLRELDVHPDEGSFVTDTLHKYVGLSARIRKTFEALREENAIQRRQQHGDEIDFDALVEAFADLRSGEELSDRLFIRNRRFARNIAVMFMVDMSGSTKGWINDAERESLVLLCQALEILGDRYAIYGFSGITRKRCELYRVKNFDEAYTDQVRARIAGIKPRDYTRMGVAIRHLCTTLGSIEARTKLLITLSDGKPDDYDGYRGEYGIEDTRQALLEAKRSGIHNFCITIDHDAKDYLPHMYGAANYVLVDDVHKLPLKVADIYRHLTS